MKQKESSLTHTGIAILTVILVILIIIMMNLVSSIQGTARIVNYAGLVRGGTQRLVKLEIVQQPQDNMMQTIESYIDGLKNGSSKLNFVRLNDTAFQMKVQEQKSYFQQLKTEIQKVRAKGYQHTHIIEKSETFFKICDEATGLAEKYSQKKASQLRTLEILVTFNILGLMSLITIELIRALRYAAMNRELQKKVYLDEATGIPNKNKCEELLGSPDPVNEKLAICVFDLNNLRTINNSLGHEKGDEYIRNFAQQLYEIVPKQYFTGRNGGDEFIVIFKNLEHEQIEDQLQKIRACMDNYSVQHPEMPLSYAVGYALSSDWPGSTMRMLFDRADRNMYIHKNHMKLLEAQQEKQQDHKLLQMLRIPGHRFSNCLYCDAKRDIYRIIRKSDEFLLASEGNYSSAIEQFTIEGAAHAYHAQLLDKLQLKTLQLTLNAQTPTQEIQFHYKNTSDALYGKIMAIFVDADENGNLHHFLLAFESVHSAESDITDARYQLQQYYEQLKASILEDENYVDALLGSADMIYSINLTEGVLEHNFFKKDADTKLEQLTDLGMKLPCSYETYCKKCSDRISEETRSNYHMVDTPEKLLARFRNGEKQITVEYREKGLDNTFYWIQKTVLISESKIYDPDSGKEIDVVHGIALLRNITELHDQEQKEVNQLRAAYEEAEAANQAKTAFLSRISHDIRTPINGIMGMLEMIRHYRNDQKKVDDCLEKINISSEHLLLLINDVLDMSKLEAGYIELEHVPFLLTDVLHMVSTLDETQISQMDIHCKSNRGNFTHNRLIGSPMHLRQILLNLFSNAVKYNKPGGIIQTYSEESYCENNTAWFLFRISDTGVGMSQDFVENHLFEPFTQEKNDARTLYHGTGLGMAIVKELVEAMGGSIQVESTLNVGTTFTVKVPFEIDSSKQEITTNTIPISEHQLDGLHILLVEDNSLNMEIAEFMLSDQGAIVQKAWNGKEAVEQFVSSAPGDIDLILMDIMMPVMDGLEAAKEIRRLDKENAKTIPIVAMTANAFFDDIETSKKAGMNEHLSKPLKIEDLIATICKLCH